MSIDFTVDVCCCFEVSRYRTSEVEFQEIFFHHLQTHPPGADIRWVSCHSLISVIALWSKNGSFQTPQKLSVFKSVFARSSPMAI